MKGDVRSPSPRILCEKFEKENQNGKRTSIVAQFNKPGISVPLPHNRHLDLEQKWSQDLEKNDKELLL